MKLLKTKELTEFNKMIGSNLRYLRIARKLTQTKAAQCLNVTFHQFQKYESGKNCINAWRLTQLSEFFKVPVQDILDPDLIMRMCKLKEKQDDLKYDVILDHLRDRATDLIKKHPKEAIKILDLEPKIIAGSYTDLEKIKEEMKKDGIDPDKTITALKKAAKEKVKYDVKRRMVFDGNEEAKLRLKRKMLGDLSFDASKYDEFEDEYPAPLSQLEHDPKMRATYDAIIDARKKRH